MTASVVIWAQESDPPETMENVLCWQSYSPSEQVFSIPRYLEEHAERLRAKYITFIHDLSQSNIGGKRIIEHMDKGDGFSFWWMTRLSEKLPLKSKNIYQCLLLIALEEILLDKKPLELTLYSSDCRLAEAIEGLCKKLKISFIGCLKKKPGQSFSILRIYRALPHTVQGLLGLRYVFSRWSFRKFQKPTWFSGENSIFMCSYFFHMDAVSCERGHFYSRQWENLPKYFHDCGRRANWFHIYFDYPGGVGAQKGLSWFHRFNRDAKKQGYHTFLETYMSWGGLLRVVKNWLWLNVVSWRLRKVRDFFTLKESAVWLWPLLQNDWFDSLTGLTAFFNCLWIELFDAALKDMPQQKVGFYLWENQGWENALLRAWHRHGHGEIIGVQHATTPFWHLCYFDDPRSLSADNKYAKPLPHRLALNGPMTWNAFIKAGYKVERLVEVEAVRFQHLVDLSLEKIKKQGVEAKSLKFSNKAALKVLVLGDCTVDKTLKMLRCIKNASHLIDSEIFLTLKPHPVCPVRNSDFPALSFEITDRPLGFILRNFDVVFSGNSTSASLDALLAGLPVAIYLDGEDFNQSPLRGVKNIPFVSNAQELSKVIKESGPKNNLPAVDDFFWLDSNFSRWHRVLLESGIRVIGK